MSKVWKIHDELYDLSKFMEVHPGGPYILEVAANVSDATCMFEMYHSMADMEKIKQMMAKYKISEQTKEVEFLETLKSDVNYTYKEGGFYYTCKKRVKEMFKGKSYKANWFWQLKTFVTLVFYIIFHYIAFARADPVIFNGWDITFFIGFLSSTCFASLGFNVMHDGSHYAISKGQKWNVLFSKLWSSWAFNNNFIWMKHHVYGHHSFTGDIKKDPDTIHGRPFFKKFPEDKINNFFTKYQYFLAPFNLIVFPGQLTGQILVYNLAMLQKNRIWRIGVKPAKKMTLFWEWFISIASIIVLFYRLKVLTMVTYIIGLNFYYHICITPDHDMYENSVTNRTDFSLVDWGETQVRTSGNFSNKNMLFTHMFGGINYQIEHHLFPCISHVHYPKIKPIVMQTCKEFGIPYYEVNTLIEAYAQVLKTFKWASSRNSEKIRDASNSGTLVGSKIPQQTKS